MRDGSFRAGVVGLGYWGPNLARNLSASGDFHLAALCDSDATRLRKTSSFYPSARASTSLEEFLSEDLDLVTIATPVATHYDLACRCLAAGSHVLVEKPLTATAEEGRRLLELAERLGRRIFVDHTFLYTGAFGEMKKQIDSGRLGALLYIDSVRINLGLFQPDVDVIWDLAPHDLSILQYLLGRTPKSVSTMGASHNPRGTVDVAYLHLDYGEGLTAHLHVSWLSPVKVRRTIIAGTRQSLIFDDLDQDAKIKLYDHGVDFDAQDLESRRQVLVSYRRGDMHAPAIGATEALAVELREIAAALRAGGPARATGEEGLSIVRLLEAATESLSASGKPAFILP